MNPDIPPQQTVPPAPFMPSVNQPNKLPASGGMNPFTGSVNRKGYLLWYIAISLFSFGFSEIVNSSTILTAFGVIILLLVLLLIVRRMQNTGLNMLLLFALILPLANVALLISLFFIPPYRSTPGVSKPGTSKGFKIAMSLVLVLFVIFALFVIWGLNS